MLSEVDGASANCERLSEEIFNLSAYQGHVSYDGSNVAHLRRKVCNTLWDYDHGGQANPSEGQILAVHIVGHEAMHINGIRSEAVAECRAVPCRATEPPRSGGPGGHARCDSGIAAALLRGVLPAPA